MKKITITTAMILATGFAFAQQLPFSSQYYANMFVTNPAFTGTGETTNAFITHRSQWTGIAGAPQTSYLTVDGPIEAQNIGLGLKLYSDVTDITSRMGAFANYSYKLKINDDNNLFIGLSAGMLNNRIDFSKAVVRDTDDPFLFSQPQSKTVFSADLGLAYVWKKLEVGFCVPQLIGNKIKYKTTSGDDSYYNLERHYQGSLKYTFDVIKEKEITAYPLIMVKAAPGAPLQYDINAVVDWKKYGWVGITYHSNYAIAASIGLRYKNLAIGYAYDLGISQIKSYTGSSSEFLLRYTFGNNKPEAMPVVQTEEASTDSLTENLLRKLMAKTDTSQAEIERLKAELAKVKSGGSHTQNLTEQLMRVASHDDYQDENGAPISAGYYVVVGAFGTDINAGKFKSANLIKGYSNTMILQNKATKNFLVTVTRVDKKSDGLVEIDKFKIEYPDVWLLFLE